MSKEIYISSTPHETRLAIVEDEQLSEIYYERENEYTLAGSIYMGRVTRVLPGMQSAFVDVGLERDAFLYVTDFIEEQEDADDFERIGQGLAVAPSEPGGGERSSGDRNGGDRGPRERNGRDREGRGDGRDRTPRESRLPAQTVQVAAVPSADTGEGVEGEAGDGRRWRGRRGRRRGRGGERGGEQGGNSGRERQGRESVAAPEKADTVTVTQVSPDWSDEGGEEAAEYELPAQRQAPGAAAQNFTLPRSTYGGNTSSSPATGGSGTTPMVLPGESLSKYRKPGEPGPVPVTGASAPAAERKAPAAGSFFKPSTLVEVPLSWDGGLTLPGESISKRGRQKISAVPAEVSARADEGHVAGLASSGEELQGAVLQTNWEGAGEPAAIPQFAAAPIDGGTVHAAGLIETIQHHEQHGKSDLVEATEETMTALSEREQESAPVVAEEVPEPPASIPATEVGMFAPVDLFTSEGTASAAAEPERDFEPERASASYRVDPVAPIEYRQTVFEEAILDPAVAAPIEEADVDALSAPVAEVAAIEDHAQHSLDAPVLETLRSEGHSDGRLGKDAGETTHIETVRHEVTEPVKEEAEVGASLLAFAPGAGVVEEEVIDEDEYDFEPLMQDDGDLEELEEETLALQIDGAEIGDMVRDAHIDERTRAGWDEEEGEAEGDEDSEEELEEDELYEESEEHLEESVASGSGAVETGELEIDEEVDEETSAEGGSGAFGEPETRERSTNADSNRRGDGRRGGRDGRSGRDSRGGRDGRGGRDSRGGRGQGSGGRRQSAQLSNLPIISDLLKQGQEILVQIAKEPIARKGARITSHIALPGRFLVFMPTVNHVGVSRKIASDEDRQRLKRILLSEKGEASGGFIVRTAAGTASEEELRADIRFLLNLWADIKQRADSGKAPALIYHDLNLVERILRDQVTDSFSSVWVDSEADYERVLRFLQRFQPSLVRRVKLYTKETPLFEQFGIQEEINKALKSKVWLKSGGSIVINQTEALVAIDINTGKYVGKTARLEDTILKTNLDAIPEIVRQIRLRDLGGIIVIDFIDMDERKNRHRVMQALEEELKHDRAPSKVLQFNDFGLVAITRKRVKQSLERTLSIQCNICTGTGMVKSPTTVCNEIYVEIRKMHHLFAKEHGDLLLRVHPEVVKQLKAGSAKWLTQMEEVAGKTIIVKSDPSLHPEQFDIH